MPKINYFAKKVQFFEFFNETSIFKINMINYLNRPFQKRKLNGLIILIPLFLSFLVINGIADNKPLYILKLGL